MGQIALLNPHWEALTPETRQAFYRVASLSFIRQFYLAGGAGLALHLGHRFSADLRFFSPAPGAVGPQVRAALRGALDAPGWVITHDEDGTFVATRRGVSLHLLRLHLYPLVQQPVLIEGVPVATVEEIGAMKLASIADQSARKDLVDLYYVLQEVSLERLLEVAAVKYARVHAFAISATRGLAYFADAEAMPMPPMIDRTPWTTMKGLLEREAVEAGRRRLGDLWRQDDRRPSRSSEGKSGA
jgi:hypothetical protein